MGFNRRKMEDRRRDAAEKEAASRRATDPLVLEDAERLIAARNEAKRMPMLFCLREQSVNLHVLVAMKSRAEKYLRNAVECEREGARAATLALKNKYRGIAEQWREMAEQKKRAKVVSLKKNRSRATNAS
jgi:hypothetical protein